MARPPTAHAQQTKMLVIGFLNGFSLAEWVQPVTGFRNGLTETGYVEGKNVAIEYPWAEGHFDRLPDLAAELVRRQVTVLVATGAASLRLRLRRPPRRSRSYSVSASIRSRKDSFPVSAGRAAI